jgi:hypothetical protein
MLLLLADSAAPPARQEPNMMQEFRKDTLTAQKVGIGLIFKEMLGTNDARAYLNAENVPEPVIERVLAGSIRQDNGSEGGAPAGPLPDLHNTFNTFYCHSGRRRDTVRAAVVQAAITVARELGRERAERLLRREGVPDKVIARVLSDDGVRRGR